MDEPETPARTRRRFSVPARVHSRRARETVGPHLGLPGRRRRERNDAAAQPPWRSTSLALRPRVCVDVSKIDTGTTLFGRKLAHAGVPGAGRLAGIVRSGRRGHRRHARPRRSACRSSCSSVTHPGLEEIAAATPGPKIFQLYVRGDKAWVRRRGEARGRRTAMTRSPSPSTPPPIRGASATSPAASSSRGAPRRPGTPIQAGFTWDNVKHFKDHAQHPADPEGHRHRRGRRAVPASTGSTASTCRTTAGGSSITAAARWTCCRRCMAAVRGRAKVMIDGSFCRGTDIVKAIALGADAVAMGRMYCYALAADGEAGRAQDAGTAGARDRRGDGAVRARGPGGAEPGRSCISDAPVVAQPHVHSAFPLLQPTPDNRA